MMPHRLTVWEESKLQKVIDAWNVPGPRPDVHKAAINALRTGWPTLYDALTDFISAVNHAEKAGPMEYIRAGLMDSGLPEDDSRAFAAVLHEYASAMGRFMRAERELKEAEETLNAFKRGTPGP